MKARFSIILRGVCVLGLLAWSGCAVYTPKPPEILRNTEEWRQVSLALVPPGKALSFQKIGDIGLMLNPELNKARLTLRRSDKVAQYAGLWSDPSLSLEGNRYLESLRYDRSIAPGLSIPLTGVPALARKVAEAYREADYYQLRAQESDYLMRLHALYYTIQITHAKHKIIRKRLTAATEEKINISRLADSGEAGAGDVHSATQRLSDLLKELQELENKHLDKHLELISMLGLHPEVGDMEVVDTLPRGVPADVPPPTVAALLIHPRLLAAFAAHHTSEQELRLEIRKQYPNLELSPGYTKEEGDEKLTLSVGFTLPLWNRNREAIARAEGARALSRHSAQQQWHELVQMAYALQRRQLLARQHCREEFERLSALQEVTEQQESLYELGETSLPELAAARHDTYTRRLAYLDCLSELLEIQVALQYLSTPNPS